MNYGLWFADVECLLSFATRAPPTAKSEATGSFKTQSLDVSELVLYPLLSPPGPNSCHVTCPAVCNCMYIRAYIPTEVCMHVCPVP